jgi:hypothetical protein
LAWSPDDEIVYAGPESVHWDSPIVPEPGDIVVIRDGREVAWLSLIYVGYVGDGWTRTEAAWCEEFDL